MNTERNSDENVERIIHAEHQNLANAHEWRRRARAAMGIFGCGDVAAYRLWQACRELLGTSFRDRNPNCS